MGARLRATHGAESDKQDLNSTAFGRHVQVRDFSNSSPPPDPKPGVFFFKGQQRCETTLWRRSITADIFYVSIRDLSPVILLRI